MVVKPQTRPMLASRRVNGAQPCKYVAALALVLLLSWIVVGPLSPSQKDGSLSLSPVSPASHSELSAAVSERALEEDGGKVVQEGKNDVEEGIGSRESFEQPAELQADLEGVKETQPAVVVLVQGTLGQRLKSLCVGAAVGRLLQQQTHTHHSSSSPTSGSHHVTAIFTDDGKEGSLSDGTAAAAADESTVAASGGSTTTSSFNAGVRFSDLFGAPPEGLHAVLDTVPSAWQLSDFGEKWVRWTFLETYNEDVDKASLRHYLDYGAVAADAARAGSRANQRHLTVERVAVKLLVDPSAGIDYSLWENASEATAERLVMECYASLQPSSAVASLLRQEVHGAEQEGTAASGGSVAEGVPGLLQSIAVYVEGSAGAACWGCPSTPSCRVCPPNFFAPKRRAYCRACFPQAMPNCTIRRMAWSLLADPAAAFAVASPWHGHATAVAASFHESRGNMLLRATRQRAALCRDDPAAPPIPAAPPSLQQQEAPASSASIRRSLEQKPFESPSLTLKGKLKAKHTRGLLEVAAADSMPADEADSNPPQAAAVASDAAGASELANNPALCLQLQVTELFALSLTRGLLRSQRSSSTDFIVAQACVRTGGRNQADDGRPGDPCGPLRTFMGTEGDGGGAGVAADAGGDGGASDGVSDKGAADRKSTFWWASFTRDAASDVSSSTSSSLSSSSQSLPLGPSADDSRGFRVHRSICSGPPTVPLIATRVARQTYIEEGLGLIYCSVPKVACTGWKSWLRMEKDRQARGGTHGGLAESYKRNLSEFMAATHDWRLSGLGELWYTRSEPDAVRDITRRDLFRFVFVRNPFSRIVSAYLNKHVHVGGLDGGSRKQWLRYFFGVMPEAKRMLKGRPNKLLSFVEFMYLMTLAHKQDTTRRMDMHVSPQSLLCGLDAIKYDYVGRQESMADDVAVVLDRLHREPGPAFDFGKTSHATKSKKALRETFDKATYDRVLQVYGQDMNQPLNNIHYEPPVELEEAFGRREGSHVS